MRTGANLVVSQIQKIGTRYHNPQKILKELELDLWLLNMPKIFKELEPLQLVERKNIMERRSF